MPNASHTGFSDYVLYGRDGKPLAVVEAKRTSFDPEKGAKQAQLYAESYEEKYGRRPFIFMTNGLRTVFWDEASGCPRRDVSGFFAQDDLQMRMDRRGMQQILAEVEPNHEIAGRPYQIEAVKAVEEAFDRKLSYLARNGEMMPQDIRKPAFAGMNNVAQIFKENKGEVSHIFEKVKEVTANASEIA